MKIWVQAIPLHCVCVALGTLSLSLYTFPVASVIKLQGLNEAVECEALSTKPGTEQIHK